MYQGGLEARLGGGLQRGHRQQGNPHQAEIGWGQDPGQDDSASKLEEAVNNPERKAPEPAAHYPVGESLTRVR